MDLADLVQLTLRHLVPKGTPAARAEYVTKLDQEVRTTQRIRRSKQRQKFRLAPAGADGRGR